MDNINNNAEVISGTIIPRPRYRGSGDNPYETEEEYAEYLKEYYNKHFPSTENNQEAVSNLSPNNVVENEEIDDGKYDFTFDIFADSMTNLSNDPKESKRIDNIDDNLLSQDNIYVDCNSDVDNVVTNTKDSNTVLNNKITMPSFATIVKKFFSDIINNIYASEDIDYEEYSEKTR